MSQTTPIQIIRDEVTTVLRNGGVVDIYKLSRRLQPLCKGLALDTVEAEVAATVASFGGGAIWERQPGERE